MVRTNFWVWQVGLSLRKWSLHLHRPVTFLPLHGEEGKAETENWYLLVVGERAQQISVLVRWLITLVIFNFFESACWFFWICMLVCCYIVQAGLKLQDSSYPLALASQVAETILVAATMPSRTFLSSTHGIYFEWFLQKLQINNGMKDKNRRPRLFLRCEGPRWRGSSQCCPGQ